MTARMKSCAAAAVTIAAATLVVLAPGWAVAAGHALPDAEDQTAGATTGADTYRAYCSFCHDDGQTGAPRIDARTDWQACSTMDLENLTERAWHGHNLMPARNIRSELDRDKVRDAVRYVLTRLGCQP